MYSNLLPNAILSLPVLTWQDVSKLRLNACWILGDPTLHPSLTNSNLSYLTGLCSRAEVHKQCSDMPTERN
jgi:hypothetical protein